MIVIEPLDAVYLTGAILLVAFILLLLPTFIAKAKIDAEEKAKSKKESA